MGPWASVIVGVAGLTATFLAGYKTRILRPVHELARAVVTQP